MREVQNRPCRRCCAETLDGDDVDCRQAVCGVDDQIRVAGASSTCHGELNRAGNGPIEMVERSGGFVAHHRVLAKHQQASSELEPVCTWRAGDGIRSGPDAFEPPTSNELAALPVGRRMGAYLGVSDQAVLVPGKCCNLLIHVQQWGRCPARRKTQGLRRRFRGQSNGNIDANVQQERAEWEAGQGLWWPCA